jgi:hypothetical protein
MAKSRLSTWTSVSHKASDVSVEKVLKTADISYLDLDVAEAPVVRVEEGLEGGEVLTLPAHPQVVPLVEHKSSPKQHHGRCMGLRTTYTVKKVTYFPISSRDVTYQTLPGWEYSNYSRPGRV